LVRGAALRRSTGFSAPGFVLPPAYSAELQVCRPCRWRHDPYI